MTADDVFMRVLDELRKCEETRTQKPDKIVISESLEIKITSHNWNVLNKPNGTKALFGIPVEVVPDLQIVRRL